MGLKKLLSIGLALPVAVTWALVGGLSNASSAGLLGLNPVTVDCGDGSPIHANVDLAELTKLQGVMREMLIDPSDPSDVGCGMTQDSQPEQHESHPLVIGAGSYGATFSCPIKFKIKASVDEDGQAHGFQRATAPPDNCGFGPGGGQIKATVTCLAVSGKVGEMRGIVTESTGPLFAGFFGIKAGDVFFSQVRENQPPLHDEINQFNDPTQNPVCTAQLDPTQSQPIDRGDIDVHD